MNSNKLLRIILGGALLLLVLGVAHRWSSKPEFSAGAASIVIVEHEDPAVGPPQRPAVKFKPLSRRASIRTPAQPAPPPEQQRLFVQWKQNWYAAEILTTANGSNYIRYSGYGPEWDEWVTPGRMRYSSADEAPPQNTVQETSADTSQANPVRMTPEPGDPVALHGNRWWRVEVLQTQGDQSLIRYVGYGAEWDEWVGTDRFKVYSEEDARNKALTGIVPEATTLPEPEPDPTSPIQGSPAKGDLLVEWGRKWWPAEILKQEGDSYLIHYKGYGSNWDEWVTQERLGVFSSDPQKQ